MKKITLILCSILALSTEISYTNNGAKTDLFNKLSTSLISLEDTVKIQNNKSIVKKKSVNKQSVKKNKTIKVVKRIVIDSTLTLFRDSIKLSVKKQSVKKNKKNTEKLTGIFKYDNIVKSQKICDTIIALTKTLNVEGFWKYHSDISILTKLITTESPPSDLIDAMRVAQVVMNRLHYFPEKYKTIEDVVYEHKQFSAAPYWNKSKTERKKPGIYWKINESYHSEILYRIAFLAYNDMIPEQYKISKNTLYFCNPKTATDRGFVNWCYKKGVKYRSKTGHAYF